MKHSINRRIERIILDVKVAAIVLGVALLVLTGCGAGETPDASLTETEMAAVGAEQVIASEENVEEAFVTLPPPLIVQSTNTAVPPTDTPEPTATPESTNTPEATEIPPTNTPAPIPPTNPPPPPPPPTNTPEPPPPPPPPQKGANGLVASHFAVQDRSDYSAGGRVWFEFTVTNATGSEVPYNVLGVMPKKDGADRLDWFQHTYGGPNSKMNPGGLTWEDNIKMPEAGNYTLRLAICFDGVDNCLAGGGTFHTMSDEIPVQIR